MTHPTDYADALDLLLKPGWPVQIVDMVLHDVTRNATPTSEKIVQWVEGQSTPIIATRAYQYYRAGQVRCNPAKQSR